jgi:hypothetical protein
MKGEGLSHPISTIDRCLKVCYKKRNWSSGNDEVNPFEKQLVVAKLHRRGLPAAIMT